MPTHLMIESAKRYRDDRTGREYRFDWTRFWETAYAAAEQENIRKVEARLAEVAHISKGTVHDHLQNRWIYDASFPADIGIIRSYGAALTGNEEAFLRPFIPAGRPDPTSAEELKRWGELEREDLKLGLGYLEYKDSARQIILDIFTTLWDILSLYEISDGYNCRPDTGGLEGAEEYFNAMLESAREMANRVGTLRNGPVSLSPRRWQVNRLLRLIDETELFVKSCSVPGVTLRWRRINPRLNYYDPVFDMVEELSPEVWWRLWYMFGYRPTKWDFQMRQRYFSGQKKQREHFQRELVDTLEKLFHNDFFEDH